MNFLLLFAFLATLFSIVKDFIETDWAWKNTHIFSMTLSVLAVIPLLVNFIIFLRSDRFCAKEVFLKLLEAILMDSSDSVLTKLCCLERGIFCNQSQYKPTVHFGGKTMVFSKKMIGVYDYLRWEIKQEDFNDNFFFKMVFNSEIGNYSCLNFPVCGECFSDLKLMKTLQFLSDFCGVKFESAHCDEYGSLIVATEGSKFLFPKREIILSCNTRQVGISKFVDGKLELQFETDINLGTILYNCDFFEPTFNLNYNIGVLKINLTNSNLTSFYKGDKVKTYDLSNLEKRELFDLILALSYWETNPNVGLTDDETKTFLRAGTWITHCLTLSEIINRIKNGNKIFEVYLERRKHRVENKNFELISECLIRETVISKLGEKNYNTLIKIISNYSSNITSVLDKVINLRSGVSFRNCTSNSKCKRMITDLNYFLELIGYGCITCTDKKIFPSKFVCEVGKSHEKMLETLIKPKLENFINDEQKALVKEMSKCNNDLDYSTKNFFDDTKIVRSMVKKSKKLSSCLKETGFQNSILSFRDTVKKNLVDHYKNAFAKVNSEENKIVDLKTKKNIKLTFELIKNNLQNKLKSEFSFQESETKACLATSSTESKIKDDCEGDSTKFKKVRGKKARKNRGETTNKKLKTKNLESKIENLEKNFLNNDKTKKLFQFFDNVETSFGNLKFFKDIEIFEEKEEFSIFSDKFEKIKEKHNLELRINENKKKKKIEEEKREKERLRMEKIKADKEKAELLSKNKEKEKNKVAESTESTAVKNFKIIMENQKLNREMTKNEKMISDRISLDLSKLFLSKVKFYKSKFADMKEDFENFQKLCENYLKENKKNLK